MTSSNDSIMPLASRRGPAAGRNPKLKHAVLAVLATTCGMFAAVPAMAQSSTGSVYGQADAGAKVVVKSQDTGLTRELTVGPDGKFEFGTLPTGNYTVTLQKPGAAAATQNARVNAGTGTSVIFSSAKLAEVVVTGTSVAPIDTTTAQVSTTFTSEMLRDIPVAQNVIDVALLAAGTTKGDTRFGNLASFGGSSVAENSYYINGFNVTNLFQNLSYAQVPFYAIGSEQVITGGYGPEYGMSTGGVINIVTKKGTNEWMGGAAVTWEPESLRAHSPTTKTPNGLAYRDYSKNTDTVTTYDVWVGGPIIEDRLFVFAAGEFSERDELLYPNSYITGNVTDTNTTKPYGLVNVDWNITDRHLLEYTFIQDKRKFEEIDYSTGNDANGYATIESYTGTDFREEGGTINSIKYNGSITDNLTVTAQYGTLESKRSEYLIAPDGSRISYNGKVGDFNQPGCPIVTYNSTWTNFAGHSGAPTPSCYIVQTIATDSGVDKRKGGRADVTYKLPMSLLGYHTFGAGYEFDRWTSFFGESYSGGTAYRYQRGTSTLNPVTHDQVRVRHFQTGADVGVDTDAYYIKDDWQVTDTVLLQLGVRSDSFKNLNGDGVPYAQQDNIIQPRISAAWDISGDSSKKLYGSYGIYSLPIAATVAVRGASASIFSNQNFTYATINPATGAPTGLVADGPLGYLNHEDGRTLDPDTVASSTLDPTIQEEFVLGFQMELGRDWKAGIRGTYRNLKKTTDDICDLRPFDDWATRNGYAFDDTNLPGCMMINPGYAIDANVDVNGDGVKEMVHLTPEDVGLPKAIRKYYAVELSLEKLWDQTWYTQLSYTWAHNYGNAEGLVKSDIGQDDTGVTQDFDFKEIMVNSYGNLPNDRRHAFKLLAAYKPAESVTLSTNLVVQSGRPRNCFGVDQTGDVGFGYGASFYMCDGEPVPRGTAGITDTVFNMDISAAYAPEFVPGLSLKVSVFNVLNTNAATYYQEEGEVSVGDAVNPLGVPDDGYGSQRNFQRPRYVQFTLEYNFGGRK